MRFFRMFGCGEKKILAEGKAVKGQVTEVREWRWLKVNTKPVRASGMDGARFPHVLHFRYEVGGRTYEGRRYISWAAECPRANDDILVYVHLDAPEKYAVKV